MRTPAAARAALAGDIENLIIASAPGGIEAQEARGQADLCAASRLPKDGPRAELEKMGVVYGDDYDDLFVNVTLPSGWKVEPTEHSMWSKLVDDSGRERASVFYKAAFYDRRARLSLNCRYRVDSYFECDADGEPMEYPATHVKVVVMDDKTAIESFGVREPSDYESADSHRAAATAWLDNHFPNHADPTAYW